MVKDDFIIDINTPEFDSVKEDILNLFKEKLEENNINASGTLRDTAEVIFKSDNNYFSVSLNLQDYYKFIDKGVNGTENSFGSPYSFSGKQIPMNVIENWIKVKPVIPYANNKGKMPTTSQLAFVISRTIPKKGIEPRSFMTEMKNDIQLDIKDKIINIIYNQLIKKLEID